MISSVGLHALLSSPLHITCLASRHIRVCVSSHRSVCHPPPGLFRPGPSYLVRNCPLQPPSPARKPCPGCPSILAPGWPLRTELRCTGEGHTKRLSSTLTLSTLLYTPFLQETFPDCHYCQPLSLSTPTQHSTTHMPVSVSLIPARPNWTDPHSDSSKQSGPRSLQLPPKARRAQQG